MKTLLTLASIALLTGCATKITMYSVPEGREYATLSNELAPITNASTSTMIAINRGSACKQGQKPATRLEYLFGLSGKSKQDEKDIGISQQARIEAGKPIRIHYYEHISRRQYCEFEAEFTPQAGKHYALFGGQTQWEDNKRGCQIVILNVTDRTGEKLMKVNETGFCNDD